MLVNRLTDHALGKIDLSQTQVRSIEILLRKTLADLSQVQSTVNVVRTADEMSAAELTDIAAGSGAGAFAPPGGSSEPDQIH